MAETKLKSQAYGTYFNAPKGFLLNGKIVPSVASNNLTVALKTLADADPSASDPIIVRMGDTVRQITSALSFTLNAGTNLFNAGSTELATKEIDYFVFLVFVASNSTIGLGMTRTPAETLFTGRTNTTNKYMHYSGTLPADTDTIEYIGRFGATLSAGAGYTWSVPTFTSANLIQRPIYDTRWLTFAPVLANGTSSTVQNPLYRVSGDTCTISIKLISNTSNSTSTKSFVAPFELKSGTARYNAGLIAVQDNNANQSVAGHLEMTDGSATVLGWKAFYEVAWTNTGSCALYIDDLTYQI